MTGRCAAAPTARRAAPPVAEPHDDSYALEHGHPTVAAATVCVDFDGTIIPWGSLDGSPAPFAGARDALLRLKAAGYRIVILTSRASTSWWDAEALARGVDPVAFGSEQLRYVIDLLERHGIPFDEVTAEKVPALAYFDDRARSVERADGSLADAIAAFLGRSIDEVRVTSRTGGEKGQKQARLGGSDALALLELARVYGYGEQKYARYNYLKGYPWSLSVDAAYRHLLAFLAGEDRDRESGLLHTAHLAWHALTLTSFLLRRLGDDDRAPGGADGA